MEDRTDGITLADENPDFCFDGKTFFPIRKQERNRRSPKCLRIRLMSNMVLSTHMHTHA